MTVRLRSTTVNKLNVQTAFKRQCDSLSVAYERRRMNTLAPDAGQRQQVSQFTVDRRQAQRETIEQVRTDTGQTAMESGALQNVSPNIPPAN